MALVGFAGRCRWRAQGSGHSIAMESEELICVEASSLAFLASLLTSRLGFS